MLRIPKLWVSAICVAAAVAACTAQAGTPDTLDRNAVRDGYATFSTDTILISLPSTYVQLDKDEYLQEIARSVAPSERQFDTREASAAIEFIALSPPTSSASQAAMVLIAGEHTVPFRSLSQIAQASILSLPNPTNVEQHEFQIDSTQAVRVSLSADIGDIATTQVQYLVILRGSLWSITFTAPQDPPNQLSQSFDISAASFRVLRNPTLLEYVRDNYQAMVILGGITLLAIVILVAGRRRPRTNGSA